MPLGGKTVVGGLSARRYIPGKVAPGGFHCRTRVSLVTSLPFAIAQHPHPRESERWSQPLPTSPSGRAGWGIRTDRPMKHGALRPGSGLRQGGRARTHRHAHRHTHTLTLGSGRARTHTCTRTPNPAQGGKSKEGTGPSGDRLGSSPDRGQPRQRSCFR